ncbi:MAG: bifunctional hydroxymethylpyrimidine kinase/phosphomethylpyrimidine kinase [Alphaproteobacteria bacterium]|nr:bifunctional hydroxymethylpyrimidine kinase/phosphomethylpyrimidine kinase [Alphaproteobacteria bacterium]
MIPNILSIAGSDPSGGAGIQADLKTFSALGCYGMAVVTSLTAQNTQGVTGVVDVPPAFVKQQIDTIFDDIEVAAVKIGMLSNTEIMEAVANALEQHKPRFIVLDPVMVATSGDSLITSDAIETMKKRLIPMADLITPNIPEAEKLMRKAVIDMEIAAESLCDLGCKAVFLKGGHLKGEVKRDVLFSNGTIDIFETPRIETKNTHGTGCTLSSAIAAYIGHGYPIDKACESAKNYVTEALKNADQLSVGKGHGPVNHLYKMLEKNNG